MFKSYKVILGLRSGEVSGVDVFSTHLCQALTKAQIPARILLTQKGSPLDLPLCGDFTIDQLNIDHRDTWPVRWQKMIQYLENEAPCVYIPNYDYAYSCVSPKLSDKVMVLGIIHSDDPLHYEHVMRLGRYWNRIVAVSKTVASKALLSDPALSDRMTVIPYGIEVPDQIKVRANGTDRPIRIAFVGRLVQHQKKILEIPKILQKLKERDIPFVIKIIGDGPERNTLLDQCEEWIRQGMFEWKGILPNREVQNILSEEDVIILTSEFEGLPICLLEGMSHGCIPVCMRTESGLPELIQNGQNGYLIDQGDHSSFAERLAELQRNSTLRKQFSRNAYDTIKQNYHIASMLESYVSAIECVVQENNAGIYRRPAGEILPPPMMIVTWKDQLSEQIRRVRKKGRLYFRRIIPRVL